MQDNFSEKFDVVIVGSGPAGGECARELAKRGRKILLMEKSTGIGRPNFSSGGTPLETFRDFDLPLEVGRGSWSKILLGAYGNFKTWDYGKTCGYVFAFDALKQFLVSEAVKKGARVMISTAAEEPVVEKDIVTGVKCKGVFGEGTISAKMVVDASGPVGVLASRVGLRPAEPCAASIAIEFIVQGVPEEFKNVLAFYFGYEYAPYGYAWVFPFGKEQLKVGIAVYKAKEHGISEENYGAADMMKLFERFVEQIPQLRGVQPIDLHGGNIYVNGGIQKHSRNGLLAIGDAAMQINPLAGEGIRHALHSGRMAAEVIDRKLSENDLTEKALSEYDDRWKKYVGKKWQWGYLLTELIHNKLTKNNCEILMKILSTHSSEEIFDAAFNYKFLKITKLRNAINILRAAKILF